MGNYINILSTSTKLGKVISEGIFALICDIYKTLARFYDLVLNIATTRIDFSETISNFTSIIYVLMGVFMLFRITVSFLNMLVDPDKINDKSAGATAIIKRVFISLLLLIVLKPDSFGFNFMYRLEEAILAPDGIISSFVGSINYDSLTFEDTTSSEGKVSDCYFFEYTGDGIDNSKIFDAHHFRISSDRSLLSSNARSVNGGSYYIEFLTDSITTGGSTLNFSPYNIEISSTSSFSGCPAIFTQKGGLNNLSASIGDSKKFGVRTYNFDVQSSETEFMVFLGKYRVKHSKAEYSNSELQNFAKASQTYYEEYNDTNASDGALSFSRGILKAFISSNGSNVNEITEKLLLNSSGNQEVFDAYMDDKIDIDLFLSLIVGLVITVYLVFICVDVVIRSLKLLLLQLIAPVAVISYIDPKDKIFNEWGKMYLSTYADIFIKLFSIGFVMNLMEIVINIKTPGWSLFYIIGLLIFIKAIPTMINKIFGIDVSSGSFKDIWGTAKKGIGIATGAIAGGFVGAATAKGFGRVSGALRGALQGAGSGYKGDTLGGAHKVAAKNFRINDAKADGLGFFKRSAAEMAGTLGISPKTRLDNKIKAKNDDLKTLDDWRGQKDKIEEMAEKNNVISDLKTKLTNGEIGKEDYKAIRKEFIRWMTNKDKNGNFTANKDTVFKFDKGYKDLKTGEQQTVEIKFSDGDAGKVRHAFEVAQTTFASNSSLQKLLSNPETHKPVDMNTYDNYLASEEFATNMRNSFDTEIVGIQQSDEYRRAVAFDDYSKQSK